MRKSHLVNPAWFRNVTLETILLTFTLLLVSFDGMSSSRCTKPLNVQSSVVFQLNTTHDLDADSTTQGEYRFITAGDDPYVLTKPLNASLNAEETVLTFEYTASDTIDQLQLFLAAPLSETRSKIITLPKSPTRWKTFSVILFIECKKFEWGHTGDYLRMDFGQKRNITIHIRNMHFRHWNAKEQKKVAQEESKQAYAVQFESMHKEYLTANYSAGITNIKVHDQSITITGNCHGTDNFALAEITPYQDITKIKRFTHTIPIKHETFTLTVDRKVKRDGFIYDRILSKWAIIKTDSHVSEVVGCGRYADDVSSSETLAEMKPTSKKGLGGFHPTSVESDLDDLGIHSVTINIAITDFEHLTNPGDAYSHEYGGKTYYFDKERVDGLDVSLKACQRRGIVVSAIILIQKRNDCADKRVGALLEHPDFNGHAFYSMPNMTTPASVNCYAAALDFFASRYCRTGSPHGRIHKWIMHNEVDISNEWTNMGKPAITTFTDTYVKSMRMCYNIVHQYDPHPDVLASFSHNWAKTADYAGLDILNLILKYSANEGDFHWGVAWHCYAQEIKDPCTWLDTQATFSLKSPLVTFKNLEVLDKWIKLKPNLYRGTTKRTLWLSENGTNSPTYSETDLAQQAAGFAYGWQKIKALDGIDAFQWHHWADSRHEFGLRLGLRRFDDDETDPLGKKLVWYVYEAAGTANEEKVFAPYLKVIGITDWHILQTVSN